MATKKEITFEKALERLEEIVNSLECGDAPLDKSLSLFEEGVALVKLCSDKLEQADKTVKQLVISNGELVQKIFSGEEENEN